MPVDASDFRDALSRWASGVTVVTTENDGQQIGITATSFSSVSLQPPLILICVDKRLYTHGVIEQRGAFAVNLLNTKQVEWGLRFAGMIPELEDRFEGLTVERAATGCPVLVDALAWVDCLLYAAYDGGDHTIFVGQVEASGINEGEPLLYFGRQWLRLHEEALG